LQMERTESMSSEAGIEERSVLFTPESVYTALQEVEVGEDGNVVLDHKALLSLDEALQRIHTELDGQSRQELLDLIKEALPGKVGEQTAQLVDDYSKFLGAEEEFNQIHQNSAPAEMSVASLSKDQALYTELQALREVYLGPETTGRLFLESDSNAEFMFESLKLGLDDSLTAEQRTHRQQELEAQHAQRTGRNSASDNSASSE